MAASHDPIIVQRDEGRILVFDSATYVGDFVAAHPDAAGDCIVNASYAGVLCAKMVIAAKPLFVIGLDCAIGKDGAGVAGLAFYEALDIPAAAADVMTAEMGNGRDLYEEGIISRVNDSAEKLGIKAGMTVRDAADAMLSGALRPQHWDPARREVMVTDEATGRSIVCTDSIAFALPEDKNRNVLCTAGHTGRSVVGYFREYRPWAFICSDGGIGKNESGVSALADVEADGIPGASVDALTARMGDGHSTYLDGIISAVNAPAAAKGVYVGQTAIEAAKLLLN
jgi:hypothetical protein